MGRIYINGTAGENNIALTNCTITSNTAGNCKVYSNTNGTAKIIGCDFSNVDVPVNLNHKEAGTQSVEISCCGFTVCGTTAYDYAAPVQASMRLKA